MERQITATKIFQWLNQTDKRINLLVGGAGSSKSYSVAQWIIKKAYSEPNKRFLITRKTLPSLRITAYKLIIDLLNEYNLDYNHNRSELTITTPLGSELLFKSFDEPEKIKSAEFNYVWVEEATEITLEDFRQINLRLRRKNELQNQIFLTCNPISRLNWVYMELVEKKRDDTAVNVSTYKNNPFLDKEYITQIEDLINQDLNYYKIYCLGEWGVLIDTIYSNYVTVDKLPDNPDETIYGLDFGFNNPSSFIKICTKDQIHYVHELLYETHLTNQQLIERLKTFDIGYSPIYADTAEPARIEEICQAGFLCLPAEKEVKDGIDYVKRHKLHITKDSVNVLKEIGGYTYRKDKDNHILEEPVKFNDHTMDAIRYALYTRYGHEQTTYFRIG